MTPLLILFGATGDLASRKLIPSLYYMFTQGTLKGRRIVSVARRDLSGEKYHEFLKESLSKVGKYDETDFKAFCGHFEYFQLDFSSQDSYVKLSELLDGPYCNYTKFFYLAVPQNIYVEILQNLSSSGLGQGDARIIIEKPFGFDRKSFDELELVLSQFVSESHIYRIDHYLGKSILRSLPRFIPNRDQISEVYVNSNEILGVENRGDFYDINGAFRDVGGNHLLEAFALIFKEEQDRLESLKQIVTPSDEEIVSSSRIGQYEGYSEIEGVQDGSITETYFNITLKTKDGIKLNLEGGKGLAEIKKYVKVIYKDNSGFYVDYGPDQKVCEIKDGEEFVCYDFEDSKDHYVREYAMLLEEAFKSNKEYFISNEEVEEQWRITDAILKVWRDRKVNLFKYKKGEKI